jgi:hypothetical protein
MPYHWNLREQHGPRKTLSKNAADKLAELGKLNGAAFDKAYIANEVAYHKAVNSALETTLIPSASNAELKSLLQTGLKIFQGHQQHAEHVAAELKQEASDEAEADFPTRRADIGGVRLGAGGHHSNLDGKPRDRAGASFCKSRRHHRMGQQGCVGPYRHRAKRRLRRHADAEEERHLRFEKGPAPSSIIAASIPT